MINIESKGLPKPKGVRTSQASKLNLALTYVLYTAILPIAASIAAVKVALIKLSKTKSDRNMFINHAIHTNIIIQTAIPVADCRESYQM